MIGKEVILLLKIWEKVFVVWERYWVFKLFWGCLWVWVIERFWIVRFGCCDVNGVFFCVVICCEVYMVEE